MENSYTIHTHCYTPAAYRLFKEAMAIEVWQPRFRNGGGFIQEAPYSWLWGVKLPYLVQNCVLLGPDGEVTARLTWKGAPVPKDMGAEKTARLLGEMAGSVKTRTEFTEKDAEGFRMMAKAVAGELTAEDMESPLHDEYVGRPLDPFMQVLLEQRRSEFHKRYDELAHAGELRMAAFLSREGRDEVFAKFDASYKTLAETWEKYVGTLEESREMC